jgi:hypothetical protein
MSPTVSNFIAQRLHQWGSPPYLAPDDQQTRARATPLSPLGWLSKPYTMTSLINQVREAIAKSSSR